MSKKLDPRIPKDSGSKSLTNYAALCSPWNHLVGYQEAMHWLSRYNASFSAACNAGIQDSHARLQRKGTGNVRSSIPEIILYNETVWKTADGTA